MAETFPSERRDPFGGGKFFRLELKSLERAFLGVTSIHILGFALLLAANIILARTLSVADYGQFGIVISLATVLTIPVTSGTPGLLIREVARNAARGDWGAIKGAMLIGFGFALVVAALLLTVCILTLFFEIGPRGPILLALPIAGLVGISAICNGVTKGFGRPGLAELPSQLALPGVLIAGYTTLWASGYSDDRRAVIVYLLACLATMAFILNLTGRQLPFQWRDVKTDIRGLPNWIASWPTFTLIGALIILHAQIAILALGIFGETEAAAHMRVADRGAQLVAFPMIFVAAVIGPYFVRAYEGRDRETLVKLLKRSSWLALGLGVPAALLLLLLGRQILSLTFGASYAADAYLPMIVLILSNLIALCFGHAGGLLTMCGAERQTLFSLGVAVVVVLALLGPLINCYGATGAALAVGGGHILARFLAFFAARRLLNSTSLFSSPGDSK